MAFAGFTGEGVKQWHSQDFLGRELSSGIRSTRRRILPGDGVNLQWRTQKFYRGLELSNKQWRGFLTRYIVS